MANTSLEQLNDIVIPASSWWPLAPGMWWLLATLGCVLAILGLRLWRHYNANAYRRAGLKALQQAQREHNILKLPELLKRVALAAYGERQVAALSGDAWLKFLAQSSGLHAFLQPSNRVLTQLPYQPDLAEGLTPEASTQLFALSRQWVLRHRVDK